MCGGEETTTWPYPTTVALLTAKRGSNERKTCDVIQATAAMITATKHAINHFTDKRLTRIRLEFAIYFRVFQRQVCRRTLQGVNRDSGKASYLKFGKNYMSEKIDRAVNLIWDRAG